MSAQHVVLLAIVVIFILQRMVTLWLRGTAIERQSLASELTLSCTRLAADG